MRRFSVTVGTATILAEIGRRCSLTATRTTRFSATGRAMRFSGGKEDNKLLGVE